PPRLLATAQAGERQGGDGTRMERWLLLPVPRLQVRSRRARPERLARADESRGAALQARGWRQGHHWRDRRAGVKRGDRLQDRRVDEEDLRHQDIGGAGGRNRNDT